MDRLECGLSVEQLNLILQNQRWLILSERPVERPGLPSVAGAPKRSAHTVAGSLRLPAAARGRLHHFGANQRDHAFEMTCLRK